MVSQVNKGQQQANVLTNAKQQKVDLQNNNANTAQANAPKAAADSVSLTPQAQQLKSLQEKAQQSSGFDSTKVAELKKAISEGKYQIDAEKLAKNIAAFEFDVYG
ncbi:flagellar biosynthesis anti-sigma factor FlgM [Pseudoalteromonas prydzensis]|uniref:flagellar biosynthesis anti-sigma factor FlgM n=1 Tax=Pseudoalteromonas prydzensis TaxID=182141 RepID=UPI0007E4E5FF|nr:flagellar biosynthesis anti-sigma factor FlgM [Pseudoalteromonas prydzensis]MBE0379524.1 negative regulator of flagellin synthesis FlgM [Pseudoalteromonas prydzensis ACAM 620]